MIFRYLFLLTVAILIANIDGVMFGDQILAGRADVSNFGNMIEKSLFAATGLAFILTRQRLWLNITALGLIILVTLVCASLSRFVGFEWSYFFRNLFSLTSLLLLLTASSTRRDQIWVMNVIAFAPLTSVLTGAIYTALGVRSSFMIDVVGVTRLQGSFEGPAWLGAMASCAVFCTLRLADVRSRNYICLFVINVAILTMTAARTPITVGAALSFTILFFGFRGQFAFKLFLSCFAVLFAVPVLIAFGDNIIRRFTESGANGRDILWESVEPTTRTFSDFGIGLGHQPLVLPLDVAREAETFALHNEFLRLSLELGTIGSLILFLMLIIMMVNLAIQEKIENKATYLVAMAGFALYCYSDNALNVPSIFLLLPIAAMATKPAGAPEPNDERLLKLVPIEFV
jgi:hypothetical protein